MVFARLFTGGTIKHLNMWGTLINSTLSLVALAVLRHRGRWTARADTDIRAASYIHISPSLLGGLAAAGRLNSAQKLEFLLLSQAFWRLLPSATRCNFSLKLTKQGELSKRQGAQDPVEPGQHTHARYTVPITELSEDWSCAQVLLNIGMRWIYVIKTQERPRGRFTCCTALYKVCTVMLQNLVCGSFPSICSYLSISSFIIFCFFALKLLLL